MRMRAWGSTVATAAAITALVVGGSALPAQAVYPIVNPPSAPRSVAAVAGDAKVTVAWQVPASDGGAPITGYRVTSSPASAGCTVGGAVLTCDISGLTNGTSYVFSVQALNSAGYGAAGTSNAVTPQASAPTIAISGVRSGGTVSVSGTTTNVPTGAVLSSWIRLEGSSSFTQGSPVSVGGSGAFSWSTSVSVEKGIEVYFSYQGVDSNVVAIAADVQTSLAIGGSRSSDTLSISGLSTNIAAGSSITILTRVNGVGDFASAGSATVGADGRFSWSGTQAADDQVDVVAEFSGLRSNILSFSGIKRVSIVISGSRSANGRSVGVVGSTTGIPAGAQAVPTVTLDGVPASGVSVAIQSGGGFQWQRNVGAQRTVAVSFSYQGTSSNLVTLVPGVPTIGISGERVGGAMVVSGLTSSMDEGTSLTAYVRVQGDVGFTATTSARVDANGTFSWTRPLVRTRGAEVYFSGGGASSNTVVIPADASTIVITGTRTGTTIAVSGLASGLTAGSSVRLFTKVFGANRFSAGSTTTVSANGSFAFTASAARDKGIALYVMGGGAESNMLVFNPLDASIVLYSASLSQDAQPVLSASGQAFNVPVGTVVVPYVSLDNGPFTTGVGVRTLNDQGAFSWSRLIAAGRSKVSVYFATVEGVTSNTITLRR